MRAPAAVLLVVAALGVVAAADTPAELRARAAAIRAARAAIAQECQKYANGDWAAWYKRLSPFRISLRPRLDKLLAIVEAGGADPGKGLPSPLLQVPTTPPMYELPSYAMYLLPSNDDDLSKWARELPPVKAFVTISQWLKRKDIDLMLVPSPRMAEVYGDLLADGAPPERIIAPQLRRLALNLLEADVEVVDLIPLFLNARATRPQPLYLAADGHWSDAAQRIAAAEIGRRLKRYDFVKIALGRKPLYTATPSFVSFKGATFNLLSPPQQEEVKPAVEAMPITKVAADGTPFEEPADSPVVVIGDSFTHYFQLMIAKGTGIDALLSKEINIPVSNVSSAGGTLDPIKEFLRRPELLRGRRVVVWIFNNSLLTYGAESWNVPPLPK